MKFANFAFGSPFELPLIGVMPPLGGTLSRSAGKADVPSIQERQELLNKAIDGVHKVFQRWEQRFTPANPNFAQRFLSGEQAVILHFRPRVDSTELWVAQFVHEHRETAHCSDPIGMAHDNFPYGKKKAVFARIVKLTEQPKRVVPVSVRLQGIDEFYRPRLDELYVSSLGVFVLGKTLTNRKLASAQLLLRQSRKAGKRQLRYEMVKCAPEIVDNISRRRESVERHMVDKDLTRPYLFGLNLNLSTWAMSVKCRKARFHITEVLFGPLNLRPHQGEARLST
jgi:hypothetical protein